MNLIYGALRALAVLIVLAVALPGAIFAQQPPQQSSAYSERKREINENVVTIMASGVSSPYTVFAEDMRDVLDQQESGGLRVLPMLGKGGANNALDVLLLKGVDMGIVEQSDLEVGRQKDPTVFATVESRLHYIAKLANSEFQMLAQKEYKTLYDLEGKKVNYFKKGSSTDIVCTKIFGLLNIKVEPVYLDQNEANAKLKTREIAAAARFAGAPHNAFTGFKAEDGLHFMPVDADTIPVDGFTKIVEHYSPALLKNEHFPALIEADRPISTVAGAMLLVVYNWPSNTERYQRVSNFINQFFSNIDKFKGPGRHPKWKEINLAANVPGWTRFQPAQAWLDNWRKQPEKSTASSSSSGAPSEVRAAFDEFLKAQTASSRPVTPEQREAMFGQFMEWWNSRQKTSQR
jgi:TRAP-type uncharacterized transport system substrate-binding protein